MVYAQDHNVVIAKLADLFPKAFFEDPRKRVPLKSNIVADVDKQGCQELIGLDVSAAIDWYMGHLGYQMSLTHAGRPRVDLNGRLVSKVTAQEARNAEQEVARIREDMAAQQLAAASNPMHRVVHLGHDLMSKVDAPAKQSIKPKQAVNPRAELTLQELVASMDKKLTRVSGLLESEDDEFKTGFLVKVLAEIQTDVVVMIAKLQQQ